MIGSQSLSRVFPLLSVFVASNFLIVDCGSPMKSCLNPTHEALSDLGRLLDLLLFCHKYVIAELEAHILPIVIPLTTADTLRSHLTAELTAYRLVEISNILSLPEIAATARTMILDDLWSDESQDAFDALLFGEQMADKEIVGAAYYQILVSRLKPWAFDKRLTEQHRLQLKHGEVRCTLAWNQTFDSWGLETLHPVVSAPGPHIACNLGFSQWWLHNVWVEIARGRYLVCDVVGRIRAACRCTVGYDGHLGVSPPQELEKIKATLYTFFVPEVTEKDVVFSENPHAV